MCYIQLLCSYIKSIDNPLVPFFFKNVQSKIWPFIVFTTQKPEYLTQTRSYTYISYGKKKKTENYFSKYQKDF